MRIFFVLVFLLFTFSTSAYSQVYKCQNSGSTVYSSLPCGHNAVLISDQVQFSAAPQYSAHEKDIIKTPVVVHPVVVHADQQYFPQPVQKTDCTDEENQVEQARVLLRQPHTAAYGAQLRAYQLQVQDAYDACYKSFH